MSEKLIELAQKLYEGDAGAVEQLAREALAQGLTAAAILDDGLLQGMDRVGREFRSGELFIPEVIVAARAMHAGIEIIRLQLLREDRPTLGKVVLGTVKGDMHDIGKRLVGIMLQGAGFEVLDLGHDVAPERFVAAAQEQRPQLLGMSALLSTTMPMMKTTIAALRQAELGQQVKVLVGGAPVTADWAAAIGADGYAPDAVSAVEQARALVRR